MLYIKKMTIKEAEELVFLGVLVRLSSLSEDAQMRLLPYGDDDIIEIPENGIVRRYRPR